MGKVRQKLSKWALALASLIALVAKAVWNYRNDHYIVFYELIGVIMVGIGIAMIYLPLAFVVGGVAVLILTQARGKQ